MIIRPSLEMSWTAALLSSLEASGVRGKALQTLSALRETDKQSRKRGAELWEEEAALLEEVKRAAKDKGAAGFDEAKWRARADALIARRQEFTAQFEEHLKCASALYNVLDEQISVMDANTREISNLYRYLSSDAPKKRRKNASVRGGGLLGVTGGTGEEEEGEAREANEPTYCLCHQEAFGDMVACENSDCPIEWFHYPCVGLKEEPVEAWYCSLCRTDGGGAAPIASLPSTDDEAESTNLRGTNNEGGETESEHEE